MRNKKHPARHLAESRNPTHVDPALYLLYLMPWSLPKTFRTSVERPEEEPSSHLWESETGDHRVQGQPQMFSLKTKQETEEKEKEA